MLHVGHWMSDGWAFRMLRLGFRMLGTWMFGCCIFDVFVVWMGAWMVHLGSWVLECWTFEHCILDLGCWRAGCLYVASWNLDVGWFDVRMLHLGC